MSKKDTKGKNWLEKFQEFWWKDLTASQRRCLWGVLSAIRGPDSGDDDSQVKKGTTARIRYLLLGKSPRRSTYGYVLNVNKFSEVDADDVHNLGWHFNDHILMAINALNGVVKKSDMQDLLKFIE